MNRRTSLGLLLLFALLMLIMTGRNYPASLKKTLTASIEKGLVVNQEYTFSMLRERSSVLLPTGQSKKTLSDSISKAVFIFPTQVDCPNYSVRSIYAGDGIFMVQRWWKHPFRRLKWVVSILSFVGVFVFFIYESIQKKVEVGV